MTRAFNEQEFNKAYKTLKRIKFRELLTYTRGDRAEAEDIFQDAAIKAWQHSERGSSNEARHLQRHLRWHLGRVVQRRKTFKHMCEVVALEDALGLGIAPISWRDIEIKRRLFCLSKEQLNVVYRYLDSKSAISKAAVQMLGGEWESKPYEHHTHCKNCGDLKVKAKGFCNRCYARNKRGQLNRPESSFKKMPNRWKVAERNAL